MNRCLKFLVLLLSLTALKVAAQGTAFNYQGRLNDTGSPANGTYDFRFAVYDAVTNGNADSLPITNSAMAVSSGQFSVTLDFGVGLFTGKNYWLDIGVRTNGSTNFITLFPRQPIRPVPYAIFSTGASNLLGTLSASQITGTLPSAQIAGTYSSAVNFANNTNTFSGAFTGNGASLSNLNASQLTTGSVADARLSSNVALLNASQTFTGNNNFNGGNNFTNRANNFTGSFFGNGLVGWVVVSNTTVTALADTGYLLTSSQFTSVILPPGTNLLIGDIIRISGAGVGGWWVGQGTNQIIIGNFFGYRPSLWIAATVSGVQWLSLAASADGSVMYAAGASGVFDSTDYGHTWNGPISQSGSWNSVAASADGNTVLAVATLSSKPIQVSTNFGANWNNVAGSSSQNWLDVACSADAKKIIASVQGDKVFTNNAASWVSIGASPGTWNVVAYAANGSNCAAGNISGTVYSAAVGPVTVTNNRAITGLVISADGTKLAVCVNPGGIYTSTNSGATWVGTTAPWTTWGCLTASADCTRLIAGVSSGLIYASANFGGNWAQLAGSTNQVWSAVTASADGTKLAGAVNTASGQIYYSAAANQSTTSTNGTLTGSQSSAVELQYIGNNQFMPVSAVGTIWAN